MAKEKDPEVVQAEITDDGCIVVEFNKKLYPRISKCIFAPETLWSLAAKADIPEKDDDSEFSGIPFVEGEIEVSENGEEGDEGAEENGVSTDDDAGGDTAEEK